MNLIFLGFLIGEPPCLPGYGLSRDRHIQRWWMNASSLNTIMAKNRRAEEEIKTPFIQWASRIGTHGFLSKLSSETSIRSFLPPIVRFKLLATGCRFPALMGNHLRLGFSLHFSIDGSSSSIPRQNSSRALGRLHRRNPRSCVGVTFSEGLFLLCPSFEDA